MGGLYPLKFKPFCLEKIWGGDRLRSILGKDCRSRRNIGESWELSAEEGYISEVQNGFLKGNNLNELMEVYMGDLAGDKIYKKFGIKFPLLFKFIDANEDLSIQVHPNDELAKIRHNANGKTEMWYVIHADKGSLINAGFNQKVTRDIYLRHLKQGTICDILSFEEVQAGDVFFIPAGRVHSIGKGILLAEIQQVSDMTYRIFDYNRKDKQGQLRELHAELAIDAIQFEYADKYKTSYTIEENRTSEIISCKYFTTNILRFSQKVVNDYHIIDSFVVYMNLEGTFRIDYENGTEIIEKGETVLVPAAIDLFSLTPLSPKAMALEVYIR